MGVKKIRTAAEAVALLEQAVQAKGAAYIDPDAGLGCHYVKDGAPSCIIGHALAFAGWGIGAIAKLDTGSAFGYPIGAGDLNGRFPARVSAEAALIFDYAQELQDEGGTWGEAVAAAIEKTDRQPA